MRIGMGEIFEDYIHNAAIKKLASAFILIISLIIPLVAITAMIILSL
jgi:succinate dehydrogenase hydrophobic anchor subunit